jgi:hypothetical protein
LHLPWHPVWAIVCILSRNPGNKLNMKELIIKALMTPFAVISVIVCLLAFILVYPFFLTVIWFIDNIDNKK